MPYGGRARHSLISPVIVSSLSPATGPLLVAALLLMAAGVAKLSRPAPTGLALARLGLPGSDPVVRILGGIEVGAAIAAVALGGPAAAAVAALYLGFAIVTTAQVRQALRTGEAADCGCFGDTPAPVGMTHVALDLLLGAGALWAALASADGVTGWVDSPLSATLVAALAAVGAVGVRAVLTELAAVRGLVQLDGGR